MVVIPVSVGELYDKITILKIKLDKIKDTEKLSHIEKEYSSLMQELFKLDKFDGELFNNLIVINTELWDIENSLREMETIELFSDYFIEQARSVYLTNDRRFRVKRLINEYHNSEIQEVKSHGL